ncbi:MULTISPECIES: Qat anti-phage system TatD family nuclease QatD [Enterobacteriaceae]|uniref:Qat anti-phage system TatD family nuclease QatD n=1 Tax=Enterobacteriaceae TaxID=543 RepID=UPI00195538B3|nr:MULTISPECIES: Qat anti-phage system TatD family nuclease QatD [Enterobacterales]
MSIDMHCHLDLYPQPLAVAEECKRRGTYILSVTTTPRAWHGTSLLAKGNQRIRTALGFHPQIAHQRSHELELFDSLLSETRYVGEIGLDGGKGFKEHWDVQLKVFRHILKSVNRAGGKIMTIHSRGSASATLDEIENIDGIAILHWFTGTPKQLQRAIDLGCWFSVGPAMLDTIKGKALALKIPKSRVLTETDGPFGKFRNDPLMPWNGEISETQLATLWGMSQMEVKAQLFDNFGRLCRS